MPAGADETVAAIRATAEQGPFVVEERLSGPECSLLVLCDGRIGRPLPIAQDHKRIGEGDTGPNTGGMGAYAPAPVPYDADELVATFVQPVLDHLAAAGTPYVGVLYAGLMLTADGPRLIEFNCRFGDPEAQAVLPLVESDLAELLLACTRGELATASLHVRDGAACTVVAAAPGYPSAPITGAEIRGLSPIEDASTIVFPAGIVDGRVSGGRVLAVTGFGDDLGAARAAAYARIASIRFDGMQVRRDIGWRAPGATLTSYAAAGVDIDEGNRAVRKMTGAIERTLGPDVLRGVGSFGGVFSAKSDHGDGRSGAGRLDRRCRHQGRARRPSREGSWRRHRHRQPLHRRRTRAVGAAAVLPRLHRGRASSTPTSWPRSSRAWPRRARQPGARCSVARRPRCPACTHPARSTSPAR